MLEFLGRGAAFNSAEGNNSAYIAEGDKLFLIDCGESIFERLARHEILGDVADIDVMITHTHSDHIGSIGSLAMYSYFVNGRPLNIVASESPNHTQNIQQILGGFGCTPAMTNFVNAESLDGKYASFNRARYVPTDHCDELDSFGIRFETDNGLVYYSGDTRSIGDIRNVLNTQSELYRLYVDCTTADYPGNVHLPLSLLDANVPANLRDRVYCMHFNNAQCIKMAQELGFQIVEIRQ